MFECKNEKIAPLHIFAKRLALCATIAALLTLASLFFGVAGYCIFARLSLVDAILNASMILGGMGPVSTITSTGGKIFASIYALFSGLVFIAVIGIIFSPIIHRMLHKFHVDEKDLNK
jgi:hypothetical protein